MCIRDRIAIHADIEDEGQTVAFQQPSIKTKATGENGEKELPISKDVKIVDTISYENLAVGQEYTIKGGLMDKATGQPVMNGDKPVTCLLYTSFRFFRFPHWLRAVRLEILCRKKRPCRRTLTPRPLKRRMKRIQAQAKHLHRNLNHPQKYRMILGRR